MTDELTVKQAQSFLIMHCKSVGLSPNTVTWYKTYLRPFIEKHGDDFVTDITRHHIRLYIVELSERDTRFKTNRYRKTLKGGLSPATLHSHVRVLRRLFSWLGTEEYIEPQQNPMLTIPLPKIPQRVPKGISLEDIQKMLAITKGNKPTQIRNHLMLLFLVDTGVRIGGLVNLTVGDLDFNRKVAIVHEKGNKTRPVPFSDRTAIAIKRWLEIRPATQGNYMFTSLSNESRAAGYYRLSRSSMQYVFKTIRKAAGVTGRANAHSFRHAFARQYLLNGGDLATLADLMGHVDMKITRDYYAIFATEELSRQHKKYSPLTNLDED